MWQLLIIVQFKLTFLFVRNEFAGLNRRLCQEITNQRRLNEYEEREHRIIGAQKQIILETINVANKNNDETNQPQICEKHKVRIV